MRKTIVLGVDVARGDTGEHVAAAAGEAQRLSQDTGDRVLALHVHEIMQSKQGPVQIDCREGEGEQAVEQTVSALRSAGVTADGEIRSAEFGYVAQAILDAADECDARVVVLGSSSRNDLPYLPFGSVSNKLLHLARRPVLIVPLAKPPPGPPGPAW